MSCITIRLKDLVDAPTHFLDSRGYLTIDLDADFDIRHTRVLTELTELTEMPFDFAFGLDFPRSPKNDFIFNRFYHGQNQPLQIEIHNGGHWMSNIYLKVTSADRERIQVEFLTAGLIWARTLRDLKVNTLEIGSINKGDESRGLLDIEGFETPWPHVYPDSGTRSPVAYPLVDYGDLRSVTDEFMGNLGTGQRAKELNGVSQPKFCLQNAVPAVVRKKPYPLKAFDLRPWHHLYPIVRAMFCHTGYRFYCPVLETNYGRQLIAYLLDPKKSQEDLKPKQTSRLYGPGINPGEENKIVTVGPSRLISGGAPQPYLEDMLKPILIFAQSGVWDIKAQIVFNYQKAKLRGAFNDPDLDDGQIMFAMYLMDENEIVQYLGHSYAAGLSIPKGKDRSDVEVVEIEASEVHIKDNQYVMVYAYASNVDALIYSKSTLAEEYNCGDITTREEPETILTAVHKHRFFWQDFGTAASYPASRDIDRDITCLDILKSITHLFNLKFYTNISTRTVVALQPFEVEMYGASLPGFYQNRSLDINLIKDSEAAVLPVIDTKEVILKFKDTDLHSAKIPISATGQPVTYENEIFKATYLNQYTGGSGVVSGEGRLYEGDVPTLVEAFPGLTAITWLLPNVADELESESIDEAWFPIKLLQTSGLYTQKVSARRSQVFDIDFRVLLNYGLRRQFSPVKLIYKALGERKERFGFVTAGHYHPYLSQVNPSETTTPTFNRVDETLYFRFDQNYVDTHGIERQYKRTNLLYFFHWHWIKSKFNPLQLKYEALLTQADVFKQDFRSLYTLQYMGKPYTVMLNQISDYRTCEVGPTTVDFIPYNPIPFPCAAEEEVELIWNTSRCAALNFPTVIAEYRPNDGTIFIQLSGQNTSVITDVVFEVGTGGSDWTIVPNISPLTALVTELPFPWATIRATVSYEDCPFEITPEVTIDYCAASEVARFVTFLYVKEDGDVCVKAVIIIEEGVMHEITSFTVDLGEGPEPYTSDTEICGIEGDVVFELVSTVGPCDPLTQTKTVLYEPECATEANGLGIQCDTGVVFNRIGNLPLGVLEDIIFYQVSEDGETWPDAWERWDGNPIVEMYVRARRVITFCGDCPTICTPIIYCSECNQEYAITCVDCELSVDVPELCEVTWSGPEDFTGSGNSVVVSIEGTYTAMITCGECMYSSTFEFTKPNTGVPTDDPVII